MEVLIAYYEAVSRRDLWRMLEELTNGIPSGIPHHFLPPLYLNVVFHGDVGSTLSHDGSKVLKPVFLLLRIRSGIGEESYLGMLGLHMLDQSG